MNNEELLDKLDTILQNSDFEQVYLSYGLRTSLIIVDEDEIMHELIAKWYNEH